MSKTQNIVKLKPPPSVAVCKQFLEMVLAGKIGKITYLSSQNSIAAGAEAKSIRLDILVKDENGKTYDIEMQVANEHNIPKRKAFWNILKQVRQIPNTQGG